MKFRGPNTQQKQHHRNTQSLITKWVGCLSKAIVRFWRAADPATLFDKQIYTGSQYMDLGQRNFTPVEWMANDGVAAAKAFQSATVWIKDGPGDQISLRAECHDWRFFKLLADLDEPGHSFQPGPGFDFWAYFKHAMKMQQGKVVEVSGGMWTWHDGPPNKSKDAWHCQYAKNRGQQYHMGQLGCRGAKQGQGQTLNLTDQEILAIGDTNICQLDGEPPWHRHQLRKAYVVNYPRLMCLLLEGAGISHFAAQTFWMRAHTICRTRDHELFHPNNLRAWQFKGTGKARPWHKGKKGHQHEGQ